MNVKSRRDVLSTLAVGSAAVAATAGTAVKANAATVTQSLTTTLNTFTPGLGGFLGTLTVSGFTVANGVLSAVGTLTGNVLSSTGGVLGPVSQAVTVPLQVSGSCQILSLTLGPLDLNLLGLAIHLNQVVLTITAVPGAGNLLGNLLCQVANLLNAGGPISDLLNSLSGLLTQIIGAL